MAKTIKFNLICDDKPVRTIEDLQENFSIEDVLKYYQNGLLLRWLEVRGYEAEYKKVSEIREIEALEIVKELIKIFDIEADEKKVEEGVYMLQFLEERKELCEAYKQDSFKAQGIIDDYQTGFNQLIDGIIENPNDVARIKANIAELMSGYKWAMDLNHRQLFWELKELSPLAIMCFLMNDEARKYYLPMPVRKDNVSDEAEKKVNIAAAAVAVAEDDSIAVSYDIENNADKRNMYNAICSMLKSSDFVSRLGDNLHIFAGVTDGYWKDLETKGKKYMIISMGYGDYVRSAGLQGGDLASTDIKNKFVIVDGIDYKSNSSSRKLLYMEV
ncbi:hypothetical protein I6E08_03435 [Ligilactobacillus ruminis]|uniref:hypothetical protein n=1 Tax=Ligilactobacillus ruminis TaxID=1623 RepID=UPI001F30FC8E|nr:hypothetical protein [Ligilactobacillus ruminis]MCF2544277.1 hypothetical protein [Ligilactobacillus ruminis]